MEAIVTKSLGLLESGENLFEQKEHRAAFGKYEVSFRYMTWVYNHSSDQEEKEECKETMQYCAQTRGKSSMDRRRRQLLIRQWS